MHRSTSAWWVSGGIALEINSAEIGPGDNVFGFLWSAAITNSTRGLYVGDHFKRGVSRLNPAFEDEQNTLDVHYNRVFRDEGRTIFITAGPSYMVQHRLSDPHSSQMTTIERWGISAQLAYHIKLAQWIAAPGFTLYGNATSGASFFTVGLTLVLLDIPIIR